MATPRKEQSTNTENLQTLAQACDVNEVLLQLSLCWKMQVLLPGEPKCRAAVRHCSSCLSSGFLANVGDIASVVSMF